MSRIGKQPVAIPAGVKVKVADGKVLVEGPKGQKLEFAYHRLIKVEVDENGQGDPCHPARRRALLARAARPDAQPDRQHGRGRDQGLREALKIEGIGYQAPARTRGVVLTVGYANRVLMVPPDGVTVELPDPTTIVIKGADKQKVGQFAAEVRHVRAAGTVQGQGHPLRERTGPPQGRQVLRQRRLMRGDP